MWRGGEKALVEGLKNASAPKAPGAKNLRFALSIAHILLINLCWVYGGDFPYLKWLSATLTACTDVIDEPEYEGNILQWHAWESKLYSASVSIASEMSASICGNLENTASLSKP